MAIMKEEEKQDDLKQTSSYLSTARETAVHQNKTSHNEKKSHLSMNANLPPSSPIQCHTTLQLPYPPSALSPSLGTYKAIHTHSPCTPVRLQYANIRYGEVKD